MRRTEYRILRIGVRFMRIKRVIITGAGFSAPAKLPMQNQIIERMLEKNTPDFLSENEPRESLRFLKAYIRVGQFLLDSYGRNRYDSIRSEIATVEGAFAANPVLQKLLVDFSNGKIAVGAAALELINRRIVDSAAYFSALSMLREKIRKALISEKINVNLEDIFTSFDKTTQSREYLQHYTYQQMDEIRYSITCLFIYYLAKYTLEHNYANEDYLKFIRYIKTRGTKAPLTLITTNWDTLLEKYLQTGNVKYTFPINDHRLFDNLPPGIGNGRRVELIKMHGSIDWLRCLGCGSLQICTTQDVSDFLFKDEVEQVCARCHRSTKEFGMLLQPEIITPTMIKSFSSKLYRELWDAAETSLRDATHIIFIGYSLPIADFEFRYLLQKSVSDTAQIDVVLHHNDDPTQVTSTALKTLLPEKRYRDLFPRNKIQFFYDGFGKYFN